MKRVCYNAWVLHNMICRGRVLLALEQLGEDAGEEQRQCNIPYT